MALTSFTVRHTRSSDYRGTSTMKARNVVSRILAFLTGCAGGTLKATTLEVGTVAASGTITLSSASGTVGCVIGGEPVTVTAAGGDTATAALLVAAINDYGTPLTGAITATSSGGVVTITATAAGKVGNLITLSASGTGATASDTTLTGGASTLFTF